MRDKTYIPIQHLDTARESARQIAQQLADTTGVAHSIKTFFQGPRTWSDRSGRGRTTNQDVAHGATIAFYRHDPDKNLVGYWQGDLPEN